jgi:23S rRNA pseudouridine1911/1915/1917 synthase
MTISYHSSEESSELFEHFRFEADKGQSLLRIDKFLQSKIENVSRNRIQVAAHAGNIMVNGKPVKPNYRVKPEDLITIVMATPPRDTEVYPEDIPLDIVYEDKDILVVNKPAGMVVHPGHGNFTGTLLNALVFYFLGQDAQPYLCHRIDKDTTGLLLVAKNEIAQSVMAKQFFDHTISRKYIALVWGIVKDEEGTITGYLNRDPRNRLIMKVFEEESLGRNAVTHYKVLERFNYVTLVECTLETGRTHQIRIHFKHIGHPLFNDEIYGGSEILKGTTFTKYKQFVQNCFQMLPRQALHARSIGFTHPSTGKQMFFESELPADMNSVLEKWRKYSKTMNIEQ